MTRPPRDAEAALAAIRDVGGDELVQGMLRAFGAFATAQLDWIERQADAGAHDRVADAARALRISATQVGAVAVAKACEAAELAGAGGDATAVARAMTELAAAVAAARPWLDALAAG